MSQYLNLKPVDFDKLSAKRQAAVQWEGRILLPKYDGCLALVYWFGGKLQRIMSRDGKPVKSMDHIEADLLARYPWLSMELNLCIIGEAWSPGKPFAELSGEFRRQRPQPQLGFAPFDIVEIDSAGELFSHTPYHARVERLRRAQGLICNVFPPLPVVCEGREHAERYARNCKALGGYDGAIASDPAAPYVVSDGKGEFLKVKPLMSFTLEVVAFEKAVGEKTGRDTCALVVRFKGATCKVATGLSNDEQANPGQFLGKLIEVQCMDVYPGDDGMMREPRYCGIRDDAKADY